MFVRHGDYLGERGPRMRGIDIEDRDRSGSDRRGDLPRLGVADARPGVAVRQAHFHEAHPGGADRVVVGVALAADDDDFGLWPGDIRKLRHARRVEAGDASGGPQQ